jgi:hypothetical protein
MKTLKALMLPLHESQGKVESDLETIKEPKEDDELVHVNMIEGKSDNLLARKACADKHNLLYVKT